MLSKSKSTFLIFIFCAGAGAGAQAMSLSEAFDSALQRTESVPAQEESIYQAEETVNQAWGSIVPQLNFKTQWGWAEATPTSSGWIPSTALQLSQPIFQGYREWRGLRIARHKLAQQRVTKDGVEIAIYKNLVVAFYSILNIERDLENLNEELGFLQNRVKELERWRSIGKAQSTDVLSAKSNLSALMVKIETNMQQLNLARDQFALITGLPAETKIVDHLRHFHPTLEPIETYLSKIPNRPDVRSNKEGLLATEDGISLAKSDHLPSLAFTADRYFVRPAGSQRDVNWDAMLVLTVPIYSGGVTQSKVRQAYSQNRQSRLTLTQSERTAEQEIRQYYDATASDIKLLKLNKQNMELSEETFKEEQRFFKNGLVTNLDVLTALTNYFEAKRAHDQNRFNLRQDYLRLLAATAANKSAL